MSTTSEVAKERCKSLSSALKALEELEGLLQDSSSSLAFLRNKVSSGRSNYHIHQQISQKENDFMIIQIAINAITAVIACWPKSG